jgi:hypothetical protein
MSLPALDLPAVKPATPRVRERIALVRYAPLLAVAIALVAGLIAVNTIAVGGFYDDAFYVILAKSLATGHGYRNLNLPGAPFATHYPPGYPLFLALLWRLGPAFPTNLVLFKLANAIFLATAAGFAFRLGRERMGLSVAAALIATVAGTATTPALYLSSMVLSETMFLALGLPFLLWAERATGEGSNARASIALGACAGLLFLVRSQAIALVAAIALVYAVRRRWRESALALGASILVVLPWLIWTAAHGTAVPSLMRGDYGSYFSWFMDGLRERGAGLVFATAGRNLPDMFGHIVHRLRPPTNPIPDIVASLCVALLAAFGLARLIRRVPVTLAFLAGYLAIVAVWPFAPVRFLLGIWVLLMLVLASGAQALLEGALPNARVLGGHRRTLSRAVGAFATIVLVTGVLAYNVRGYQRRWWATTEELSARWIAPKLVWVVSHTDTAAIVATDHDEGTVYLYTGRRAVPVTTFTATEYLEPRSAASDAAALRSLVDQFGAQYLVLSSVRMRPAAAAISSTGVPLGDGEHKVVPWAFVVRR